MKACGGLIMAQQLVLAMKAWRAEIRAHPNPHVLLLKIERDIQRLIRRPIIHENNLEIGDDRLDFSAQPPVKLIDGTHTGVL